MSLSTKSNNNFDCRCDGAKMYGSDPGRVTNKAAIMIFKAHDLPIRRPDKPRNTGAHFASVHPFRCKIKGMFDSNKSP